MTEPLVKEFEVCDRIIGLETYFGDEVDYNDALYVSEFEYAEHTFVDFEDAIPFLGLVFFFQDGKTDCDEQIAPAPKGEVAPESHDSLSTGSRAEPAIGEVRGVEGKEDGVGKEVAGCETYGLRGGGVGEILRGEQCESPPIDRDILCRAKEDEKEPPPCK